jgi:hypothetical protein
MRTRLTILLIFLSAFTFGQEVVFDGVPLSDKVYETDTRLIQAFRFGSAFGLNTISNTAAEINYDDGQLEIDGVVPSRNHTFFLFDLALGMQWRHQFYTDFNATFGLKSDPEYGYVGISATIGKYLTVFQRENSSLRFLAEVQAGRSFIAVPWVEIPNQNYRINNYTFTDEVIYVYPYANANYIKPAFGVSYSFERFKPFSSTAIEAKVHLPYYGSEIQGLRFGELDFESDMIYKSIKSDQPALTFAPEGSRFYIHQLYFSLGIIFTFGRGAESVDFDE